jgi:hypothetical protein
MHTKISRIAREYVLFHEGLGFTVKGRIVECINTESQLRYQWDISHHYRPSEAAATVYYPSSRSAATVEEAESLLLMYMRRFTNLNVTPNDYY